MKKLISAIAAFAALFTLAGCNGTDSQTAPGATTTTTVAPTTTTTTTVAPTTTPTTTTTTTTTTQQVDGTQVEFKLDSSVKENTQYDEKVVYSDSYFKAQNSVFNKNLALYSYGASVGNGTKTSISTFFTASGFDNVFTNDAYDTTTASSIGYALAHKKIDDFDLIGVSIRGMGYSLEWANNLVIGQEGNHKGFDDSSKIVLEGLKNYISTNYSTADKIKLLITGYSRGGAVANVLADHILKETTNKVANADDVYVYTFEAPKGIDKTTATEYNNVFNIVNSADIIPYLAPDEYGFARCGKDIDIYTTDIDTLIKIFEPDSNLKPFKAQSSYQTEADLAKLPITSLTSYTGDKKLQTREEFYTNYQDVISYVMGLLFSLKAETISNIRADISKKQVYELLNLLSEPGTNLFNFLNPFIADDGVTYDENDLEDACRDIVTFATGPGAAIILLAASPDGALQRMIGMHYPDINYVLLKNFTPQQ